MQKRIWHPVIHLGWNYKQKNKKKAQTLHRKEDIPKSIIELSKTFQYGLKKLDLFLCKEAWLGVRTNGVGKSRIAYEWVLQVQFVNTFIRTTCGILTPFRKHLICGMPLPAATGCKKKANYIKLLIETCSKFIKKCQNKTLPQCSNVLSAHFELSSPNKLQQN